MNRLLLANVHPGDTRHIESHQRMAHKLLDSEIFIIHNLGERITER